MDLTSEITRKRKKEEATIKMSNVLLLRKQAQTARNLATYKQRQEERYDAKAEAADRHANYLQRCDFSCSNDDTLILLCGRVVCVRGG